MKNPSIDTSTLAIDGHFTLIDECADLHLRLLCKSVLPENKKRGLYQNTAFDEICFLLD